MNRNLRASVICICLLFALIGRSHGQSRLIHYWHFNHPVYMVIPNIHGIDADYSILDTSKAKIMYMENAGVSSAYSTFIDTVATSATDYDTVNLRLGATGGNALRARNPSDSMELRFYTPTTHYKNIVLKYAYERTTNGATLQTYDYSIDSGVTWRTSGLTVTMDSATLNVFSLFTENFTDTMVNNNPKLVFRVKFFGGGVSSTSGNNRFDNVTVEGDTLIACTTPVAGVITGTSVLCTGANITLGESVTGGTWSGVGSAATVSGSGVVHGVTPGIDTVKYTVTNGCGTAVAAFPVTVSTAPTAGVILGASTVCQGATATLTDAATAGSWISGSTSVATVDATGVVTGVSAGSVIITYSVTNGCGTATATHTMAVNTVPAPGTISGIDSMCIGQTTTLSETLTTGVWSSSSTSGATVDATGVVTGVTGGTVTISYTVTNTCGPSSATYAVNVLTVPSPGTITGRDSVCIGSTITLSDAVSGGGWTHTGTSLLILSGVVTGISAGIDTVVYMVGNTCGNNTTSRPVYVLTTAQCNALSVPGTTSGSVSAVIYPNPSKGVFTIAVQGNVSKATITINDIYGKTVSSRELENVNGINEEYNLVSQTPGTYFIKVEVDGQIFRDKIVIW